MSIPPMDIAQMKQVTRRINGSLPTDLSKVEANRIIRHQSVTGELAHFWFRVRNVARAPASKFAVYIDRDTMKHISDEGILFLSFGNDELEALVKKYTDAAWERTEVLEVLEISGKFSCGKEVASIIDERGYIPASFDELIAFAWQHDHFFTTREHCFVHVLEPTTRARMPHVWHDNDPKAGYPQLNLSFDDVGDGMLNQASSSSILVLVKKKGHAAIPLDDCNKAVIQLTKELAAFDGIMVDVRKLLEKYRKVQMDYLIQSVKMVRLISAIMDLPVIGYFFWRLADRVYAQPVSDDPKELNREIIESAPRIKFLRQLAKEIRNTVDDAFNVLKRL